MNQHQRIMGEFARQYEGFSEAVIVSPSALAHAVFTSFASGDEETHVAYCSLEHLKQMARGYLRGRHDADGEENPAHNAQGELPGISFSGKLQDRYPLPRKAGEEPVYKRREHLTDDERAWNVQQLRKSAKARQEHADALEAEGQHKTWAAE